MNKSLGSSFVGSEYKPASEWRAGTCNWPAAFGHATDGSISIGNFPSDDSQLRAHLSLYSFFKRQPNVNKNQSKQIHGYVIHRGLKG